MTTERMPPSRNQLDYLKPMRKGRLCWMCVLIVGLVSGGLGAIGPATRTSGADAEPADDPARPFFARHCQSCHAGPKPKGDFRLDSLALDFNDKANRERWLAVLEQVKEGTMPPKEKPRPPAQEVQTLSDWISGRVEKTEAARSASH